MPFHLVLMTCLAAARPVAPRHLQGIVSVAWSVQSTSVVRRFPSVRFDTDTPRPVRLPASAFAAEAAAAAADPQGTPRPVAFVYSDAYETRARIHKDASYAMLPLFLADAILGQKLFNDPLFGGGSARTAHRALGVAIGGLFAVNSVTGTMNLLESRHDPHAGMRNTIHGVLMLVADAGFLATAIARPNSRSAGGLAIYDAKKNQHLALAYASVSVATFGYLIELFK